VTLPLAREEKLVVREMPDELLVYDLRVHKAHCLNQTAAFVWKCCDGQTGVAELAAMLSEKLGTAIPDDVVWIALEQLEALSLLEERVTRPSGVSKLSRREAVKRLGLAAAAVPLIMSVASPTAAQAQSPCNATNCPPPRCCSAGLCVDESECELM
jgi:hypothetical protein